MGRCRFSFGPPDLPARPSRWSALAALLLHAEELGELRVVLGLPEVAVEVVVDRLRDGQEGEPEGVPPGVLGDERVHAVDVRAWSEELVLPDQDLPHDLLEERQEQNDAVKGPEAPRAAED